MMAQRKKPRETQGQDRPFSTEIVALIDCFILRRGWRTSSPKVREGLLVTQSAGSALRFYDSRAARRGAA